MERGEEQPGIAMRVPQREYSSESKGGVIDQTAGGAEVRFRSGNWQFVSGIVDLTPIE